MGKIEEILKERYSLDKERPVEKQLASLDDTQTNAFKEIKEKWGKKERKVEYDDYTILKFLRASPGKVKFNVKTAYPAMEKYEQMCLNYKLPEMKVENILEALQDNLLLIPGCRDVEGNHFLYMRPAKYFPDSKNLPGLLRVLCYLLLCLTAKEDAATNGISFMANMDGWGWSNFGTKYAKSFFATLEGQFPCRIRRFLIIDPPSWFSMVWRLIKPMMSKDFASKVSMPKKKDLKEHLHPDDQDLVPGDLGGNLTLEHAVETFVQVRKDIESK